MRETLHLNHLRGYLQMNEYDAKAEIVRFASDILNLSDAKIERNKAEYANIFYDALTWERGGNLYNQKPLTFLYHTIESFMIGYCVAKNWGFSRKV